MIYKVVIDATKAMDALSELGIRYSVRKQNHLFVDAESPDGACHAAFNKLQDKIISEQISDEVVDYLEDEMCHSVKVIKLTKVRQHA